MKAPQLAAILQSVGQFTYEEKNVPDFKGIDNQQFEIILHVEIGLSKSNLI